MRYKVDTLFHELLHVFLDEHPVRESVLLERSKSEPERTRDHLHLLALQKAVLLKLGEQEFAQGDADAVAGLVKRAAKPEGPAVAAPAAAA
jgi:hypothetical protein